MLSRIKVRGLLMLVAMAALLWLPLESPAEKVLPAVPETGGGDDRTLGVYVRDSAQAADTFENGKKMERLKEWPKAVDFFQEVLDKHADKVVPSAVDQKNNIIQYASIAVAVTQRLARWPAEGLEVYRGRFEPTAAAILEQAKRYDEAPLHRVLERYFVTDAAKVAGLRLIDMFLESGEYTAAAQVADRLLAWHPNITVERPGLLLRAALAYHLSGDAVTAKQRYEELKKDHATALGRIAGQDVVLHEELARQLQQKAQVGTFSSSDSWPMFGGNASRSAVSSGGGSPGALVYKISLPRPAVRGANAASSAAMYDQAAKSGMLTGVMPVADRGQLFFQNGSQLWAVHIETGVPLPGWVQTYGGSSNGAYVLTRTEPMVADPVVLADPFMGGGGQMPSRQSTVTLTDAHVLAVMGQVDNSMRYGAPRPVGKGASLVCLDRATGRQLWIVSPRDNATDEGAIKGLNLMGSPLVVGDNVYVGARGGNPAQGEAAYVYCYDLLTGKQRWASYLASSGAQGNMYYGQVPAQDSPFHLAYSSGRVFSLTNLGAVASLDAYSGAIAWLNLYPRETVPGNLAAGMPFQRAGMRQQANKPWEYNAAVVQDGLLFCLPADGRCLTIYDAASGREMQRIELSELLPPETASEIPQALLGVAGETVVVGNEDMVIGLNWTKWDPRKKAIENTGYWRAVFNIRNKHHTGTNTIGGRGFLTSTANGQVSVFVPTQSALYWIDARNGRVRERFPAGDRPWPDEEGPGNVLVTEDHVVLATARSVNAYTDLSRVERKYLAAITADPGNPEPHLLYAQWMFNAGRLDQVGKTLDIAIEKLGGPRQMQPGPMRDRVFADSLFFAQKLSRNDRAAGNAAVIQPLYDRAGAAAYSPSQKVSYRFSRGKYLEDRTGEHARAVELYQEVLLDPQMRIIVLGGEGGSTQAGAEAEKRINLLLARSGGTALYARFEQAAAQQLEALKASADPDKLLALAESYPNAKVAQDAMMLAAEAYEKASQPRQAAQVLRWRYGKYGAKLAETEKSQLFQAMARNYLRLGNRDAALARMQRAGRMLPDTALTRPVVLPDGKPLLGADGQPPRNVRQAADALAALRGQSLDRAWPDLAIPPRPAPGSKIPDPFDEAQRVMIGGISHLAAAPLEQPEVARYDRLMGWGGGTLSCLVPGKPTPLWTSPALSVAPAGSAWSGGNVVVWGGGEVVCFEVASGKLLWKVDTKALAGVDVVAGELAPRQPAAEEEPDAEAVAAGIRARVNVHAIRPLVWGGAAPALVNIPVAPAKPVDAPAGVEVIHHLRLLSDRVICATHTGRLMALSLADGKILWQMRLASRQLDILVAVEEFAAARIADESGVQLVVVECFNGQQVYRKSFPLNQSKVPVNIALSPDGMLVHTNYQELVAKDLLEPGDAPTWTQATGHNYVNMNQPEQLLVWGDQVLALCDNGMFVDRRLLRTGATYGGKESSWLATKAANDPSVRMRLAGSNLYLVGARSLVWYNLDHRDSEPPLTWTGRLDQQVTNLPSSTMVGRDYLVLPGAVQGGQPNQYCLLAFSLAPVNAGGRTAQSGLLVYGADRTTTTVPAGVTQWTATSGGIAYVSGDQKLYMLRGSRP